MSIFSTAASSVRPLLVPTHPFLGESLPSLIARAADAHVFERPVDLLRLAGLSISRLGNAPFTLYEHSREIAALLSTDEDQVAQMMCPPVADRPGHVLWNGVMLPRRYIGARTRRVSPQSLATAAFDRAAWMLRPLAFCPESFEMLTGACAACREELDWYKAKGPVNCGRCGSLLTRADTGTIRPALWPSLQGTIGLVSPSRADRDAAFSDLPKTLEGFTAGDAFEAIVEFARILKWPGRSATERTKAGASDLEGLGPDDLVAGYEMLSTWPRRLPEMVDLVVSANAAKDGSTGTVASMGPLWKLTSRWATNPTIRTLVQTGLNRVIGRKTMPLRHWASTHREEMLNGELVSGAEAVRMAGISHPMLRLLDADSACVASETGHRRGGRLYDLQALSASVALWRGGLRAREVAKALGVPEFALPILATTGKIERITDRDALKLARTDILYDPGSVSRLADQLRGAATFTGPTQPLGAVFATEMLCGEAWSLVIDAILDGSLPARMASADENLIHKMGIDPAATEALRVQLRGLPVDDGVTVSYAVAARLMGTGEGDISDLVRNGLIRADQPTGRAMAIKCAELKAFRDRFVFPRELAHRMQILPQQARKAGNRIGLQPHKLKKARLIWLRSEFEARFDSSANLAHEFQN
ncbi:TniQ family protein [Brevundimonas sp.]|jgi:hypothetical protein|uniref:TniQ family protein n=1 Tax=Brevundimonas sp. TaxID=1871086 RepID=UPI0025BE29BE|nr:TniQ family protein [Brevundimonas sp.]MCG2664719.1 TniQ family protein [Brevundimonas sp.]